MCVCVCVCMCVCANRIQHQGLICHKAQPNKTFNDKKMLHYEEVKKEMFFASKIKEFHAQGINNLPSSWDCFMKNQGNLLS